MFLRDGMSEGSKGHTRKRHREKHPEVTLKIPEKYPMPFVGMPFLHPSKVRMENT